MVRVWTTSTSVLILGTIYLMKSHGHTMFHSNINNLSRSMWSRLFCSIYIIITDRYIYYDVKVKKTAMTQTKPRLDSDKLIFCIWLSCKCTLVRCSKNNTDYSKIMMCKHVYWNTFIQTQTSVYIYRIKCFICKHLVIMNADYVHLFPDLSFYLLYSTKTSFYTVLDYPA